MQSTKDVAQLQSLKQHIDRYEGKSEVVLVVGAADDKQVIRIPEKTSRSDESIDELVKLFGSENVKLS